MSSDFSTATPLQNGVTVKDVKNGTLLILHIWLHYTRNECTENFSQLSLMVLEIWLLKVRYSMHAFCDKSGDLHKSPSLVVSNSKTTKTKSINFNVMKINLPHFLKL